MKKYIRYTILFFSLLMFAIGVSFSNTNTILVSICSFMLNNIIYCIEKFNERIIFFSFNFTFFIFLVGRLVVKALDLYEDPYDIYSINKYGLDFYDKNITEHIFLSLFLSLVFVFIGYYITDRLKNASNKSNSKVFFLYKESYIYSIRYISKILFYLTYIFNVLVLLDKAKFTGQMGYTELYSSYTSSLPGIVFKISEMYQISLFIFLGTLPKKKEIFLPTSLYMISGILSLVVGQRNNFVLNIIIILVYLCLRNITDSETVWFGKRHIIITICILPILVVLLNTVSYIREDKDISETSKINVISEFLYKQGASVNLIGYAETLEAELPKQKNYTFGRLIDFIKENTITQLILDIPVYKPNTLDSALYGNSFADSISYLISPYRYVRGWGYGSSYVAELYKDFSYVGIMIGNMVMGSIIAYMSVLFKKGPILAGLSLFMIRLLLYSPRDTTTSFLVTSFSLINILTIFFILIGAKIIEKKNNEINISDKQEEIC